ncbi:pectinesterase inhibitor-like [Tasmannia lanceolata]|uniref:pectinesterase inhibitor-like n=1 Tax=Tasmannia lanceolata TaxID=3420 RepID=UPI004063F238
MAPPPSLEAPTPSITNPASLSSTDPALKEICGHTDNPDLCVSTVSPLLPSNGVIDATTVLSLEIKACTQHTQDAIAAAKKFATSPGTPPAIATNLGVCSDTYSDALDQLQSATDAIAAHDSHMVNIMLSAAMSDFSSCEDGFMETPGLVSPISSYSDTLMKLTSNCLALSTLVK